MYIIEPGTRSTLINGASFVVWDGDVLVGSVWPEAGIVRTSGEWCERLELSGLSPVKDVLIRYLIRMYEKVKKRGG